MEQNTKVIYMEKINIINNIEKLNDWKKHLEEEFRKDYYKKLSEFIEEEYDKEEIFPNQEDVFNALIATPLSKVKCVIIGQDPYHDDGQAHGLCFSVKPGVAIPPSLVNIYKELNNDLGCYIPNNGNLENWANEGVLLLNTVLTVRAHQAASHQGKGWEQLTDAIIKIINDVDRPIVFLLWGGFAKKKVKMLNNSKHLILTAPHPSPLSVYRGFSGCKHFSQANDFLVRNGISPIGWQIPNQ